MESIRPSQVRSRILAEHAALRAELDRLTAVTEQLQAGCAGALAQAIDMAQSLYRSLRNHIDFEDALLVPALRDTDSWGPVRAERLTRHHAEQRSELRALSERSAIMPAQGLVQLLVALIADLRADMDYEDQEVLSSELLRDDVMVADNEAG